jgi:Domain of unknown function (DUF1918)
MAELARPDGPTIRAGKSLVWTLRWRGVGLWGTDLGAVRRGDPDMQATIGDRICIHGNAVGHPDKNGEIVEVRGSKGEPPYMVKFDDGRTRLIFPGPDAVIEHAESG